MTMKLQCRDADEQYEDCSGAAAPDPAAAAPEPELDPRRWPALVVVLSASFLGVLDFFIVNVSVPAIQSGLHARLDDVQLMIAGYGLTYAVWLITGSRLGDNYGRKKMFLTGMAGFTLASALCGLAPTPAVLIASRILQGTTAAVMFPQVLSIIQVGFPARERGLAFGVLGVVSGTASFSGNLLGGLLVQADLFGLGWRPIFLVNVPLGIAAMAATLPLLRESKSPRAARLDFGGVVLASVGLFLLVYPLVVGREWGWPRWAFVCLAASLPVLALFVLYERRVEAAGGSPLVELGLFRDPVFVRGLLATSAFYGGLGAFFLSFTVFLQNGLGLSPAAAGMVFAPFAVGFLAASTASVRLSRWLGSRLIQAGATLMVIALTAVIWMANAQGAGLSAAEVAIVLLVYGAGQGLVVPTLLHAVLSETPPDHAGSASGVLSTVQQVAAAVGVAVIPGVYAVALGPTANAAGHARAVGTALLLNIGLLTATVLLAFLLPRRLAGHVPEAAAAVEM